MYKRLEEKMNAQKKMMYRFENSLIELMQIKQLHKITVTDIAQNCNVTRQIFYRYFKDKYDLIALIYKTDYEKCICSNDTFEWEDSILCLINNLYRKKVLYQYNMQYYRIRMICCITSYTIKL